MAPVTTRQSCAKSTFHSSNYRLNRHLVNRKIDIFFPTFLSDLEQIAAISCRTLRKKRHFWKNPQKRLSKWGPWCPGCPCSVKGHSLPLGRGRKSTRGHVPLRRNSVGAHLINAAQPPRSAAAVSLGGWPKRSGGLEPVFTAARAAERSRDGHVPEAVAAASLRGRT